MIEHFKVGGVFVLVISWILLLYYTKEQILPETTILTTT